MPCLAIYHLEVSFDFERALQVNEGWGNHTIRCMLQVHKTLRAARAFLQKCRRQIKMIQSSPVLQLVANSMQLEAVFLGLMQLATMTLACV